MQCKLSLVVVSLCGIVRVVVVVDKPVIPHSVFSQLVNNCRNVASQLFRFVFWCGSSRIFGNTRGTIKPEPCNIHRIIIMHIICENVMNVAFCAFRDSIVLDLPPNFPKWFAHRISVCMVFLTRYSCALPFELWGLSSCMAAFRDS